MRQIKFRAFVKNLKWMVPVEMIDFKYQTAEVDLSYGNGATSEYEFDEIELMQSTGLKDKNGLKEIYEGDIMEHQIKHMRTVVFECGAFMTQKVITDPTDLHDSYHFYERTGKEWEVIGNVWENQELLETK